MELYVKFISNKFLRFLYSFFVQMPLTVWFRFITAYVPTNAIFINYTSVSDVVLQEQWLMAQQGLASAPFPMNYSGGGTHAADPRALTVQPKHVTVVSVPDITKGVIVTPAFDYVNCHSFACCWRKPRVYAAASEVPVTLMYEFQNVILSKLGYDVSAR
jgi:hypothetical protein